MATESSTAKFDALMARQQYGAAEELARGLRERQPRNGNWWYLSARAAFALGHLSVAHEEIATAARLLPKEPAILLQQAIIDHRIGRTEAALARLKPLQGATGQVGTEAAIVMADILSRANRQNELDQFIAAGGAWQQDARAQIFVGRRLGQRDAMAAVEHFKVLLRSAAPNHARRIAGFEGVRTLDAHGKYREAYDLAAETHASTGTRYDIGALEQQVEEQRRLLANPGWLGPRRAPEVTGIALVVALPRSGTTLIEQMFDRHPQISGIGEYQGVRAFGDEAVASGRWPGELASVSSAQLTQWQAAYLKGSRFLCRDGASWTFDKTLKVWRWLPLVALVLPGAVYIAIDRDPRDNAISMLLGNFHPQSMGWTGSIESIRRAIAAHRSILPMALEQLSLSHESMVYENFVEDPRGHSQRCFARLGLPMDEATLEPERNTRMVLTLSHEQVRKPINTGSIGRWRNYEWAFEESAWRNLVAAHDARRA
ncbi:MAG: sulfotransferase [Phycisphaerales bacterium]|nr:sulfotransferase [Phycisphaerales bacterium]